MTDKIDERNLEIKAELLELHEQKRQLALQNEDEQLAIVLHGILCHWNHTDGCGFEYEIRDGIHQWDNASHKPYLEKSRKLIRFAIKHNVKVKKLIQVFKMLREM